VLRADPAKVSQLSNISSASETMIQTSSMLRCLSVTRIMAIRATMVSSSRPGATPDRTIAL
jgi:hypothetical protein